MFGGAAGNEIQGSGDVTAERGSAAAIGSANLDIYAADCATGKRHVRPCEQQYGQVLLPEQGDSVALATLTTSDSRGTV